MVLCMKYTPTAAFIQFCIPAWGRTVLESVAIHLVCIVLSVTALTECISMECAATTPAQSPTGGTRMSSTLFQSLHFATCKALSAQEEPFN